MEQPNLDNMLEQYKLDLFRMELFGIAVVLIVDITISYFLFAMTYWLIGCAFLYVRSISMYSHYSLKWKQRRNFNYLNRYITNLDNKLYEKFRCIQNTSPE